MKTHIHARDRVGFWDEALQVVVRLSQGKLHSLSNVLDGSHGPCTCVTTGQCLGHRVDHPTTQLGQCCQVLRSEGALPHQRIHSWGYLQRQQSLFMLSMSLPCRVLVAEQMSLGVRPQNATLAVRQYWLHLTSYGECKPSRLSKAAIIQQVLAKSKHE